MGIQLSIARAAFLGCLAPLVAVLAGPFARAQSGAAALSPRELVDIYSDISIYSPGELNLAALGEATRTALASPEAANLLPFERAMIESGASTMDLWRSQLTGQSTCSSEAIEALASRIQMYSQANATEVACMANDSVTSLISSLNRTIRSADRIAFASRALQGAHAPGLPALRDATVRLQIRTFIDQEVFRLMLSGRGPDFERQCQTRLARLRIPILNPSATCEHADQIRMSWRNFERQEAGAAANRDTESDVDILSGTIRSRIAETAQSYETLNEATRAAAQARRTGANRKGFDRGSVGALKMVLK